MIKNFIEDSHIIIQLTEKRIFLLVWYRGEYLGVVMKQLQDIWTYEITNL